MVKAIGWNLLREAGGGVEPCPPGGELEVELDAGAGLVELEPPPGRKAL